jgi:hypothetical protein
MHRAGVERCPGRAKSLVVATLALAAVGLAACSSGASNDSKATTTTTAAHPTTSTATGPVATTPLTTAAGPCATSQVGVGPSTSNGAAGTQVQRFIVTNTGTTACTAQGYPFVSLFGPMTQGGSTVQANLTATQEPIPASFGDLGQSGGVLTLSPGGSVVFFIKWSDVPTGSGQCPTADGFDFRTPQSTTSDQRLIDYKFDAPICGSTYGMSQLLPDSVTS